MSSRAKPRILILANRDKQLVTEALTGLRPWLESRAEIVGEPDTRELSAADAATLPDADMAIVLGGDGTLLAQARLLVNRDFPLLGVNFGKLGFLAEFSVDSLQRHWDQIITGQCRQTQRALMAVAVYDPNDTNTPVNGGMIHTPDDHAKPVFESLAMNDAVITAGPPFRIIEMLLSIDPSDSGYNATALNADGVIISTPSGSTAYNLAAGGPIVSPQVNGFCVTPLCPHSLAVRPLVVNDDAQIFVRIVRANEGTTLVIDGQVSTPITADQKLVVRRHDQTLTIIHNPELNYWKMLARKMGWAARPRSL